ncbi:DUF302 domain-containing protein [Sinomonas gamaensis]|jgi:uncharacterized protein (DUF302 family)|uniref:DUF302 domain-containing protein n=1 Tax=Sinomonas gamaensis TaxID=2565624 RepID=UPI0011088964|nr:DUF302 domain-containing protein [Sinomonas gamaensis]
MPYTLSLVVPLSFAETMERVRAALAGQGFGILSESDIRATFAAKLGLEAAAALGDYVILGACNPGLARRALTVEPQLGALLPCNVAVRRGPDDVETTIDAVDPLTLVQLSDSPQVKAVADDAGARIKAMLASVAAATQPAA